LTAFDDDSGGTAAALKDVASAAAAAAVNSGKHTHVHQPPITLAN